MHLTLHPSRKPEGDREWKVGSPHHNPGCRRARKGREPLEVSAERLPRSSLPPEWLRETGRQRPRRDHPTDPADTYRQARPPGILGEVWSDDAQGQSRSPDAQDECHQELDSGREPDALDTLFDTRVGVTPPPQEPVPPTRRKSQLVKGHRPHARLVREHESDEVPVHLSGRPLAECESKVDGIGNRSDRVESDRADAGQVQDPLCGRPCVGRGVCGMRTIGSPDRRDGGPRGAPSGWWERQGSGRATGRATPRGRR